MIELAGKSILAVVAHPDDEVIGCGGTIARLVREGSEVRVLLPLVGDQEAQQNRWDARVRDFHLACQRLGCEPIVPHQPLAEYASGLDLQQLHDLILPHVEWADVVLTHWKGDVHQAHVAVSNAVELATRPFRRRKHVLMFEVPSSTDQGFFGSYVRNFHVLLSPEDVACKLEAMQHYADQYAAGRTPEDLLAHVHCRGAEVGAQAAESFWIGRAFY